MRRRFASLPRHPAFDSRRLLRGLRRIAIQPPPAFSLSLTPPPVSRGRRAGRGQDRQQHPRGLPGRHPHRHGARRDGAPPPPPHPLPHLPHPAPASPDLAARGPDTAGGFKPCLGHAGLGPLPEPPQPPGKRGLTLLGGAPACRRGRRTPPRAWARPSAPCSSRARSRPTWPSPPSVPARPRPPPPDRPVRSARSERLLRQVRPSRPATGRRAGGREPACAPACPLSLGTALCVLLSVGE